MIANITTTNLADFGIREIIMLRDLLDAWINKGLPDDFSGDEVYPMMNKNSGHVFLTNSEFEVCMDVDGVLCSFYSCPECGHEGFAEDMREDGGVCCHEYLDGRFPLTSRGNDYE